MSAAITAPPTVAVIAFACLVAGCVGDGGVNGDDAGGTPTTVESAPTSTSTSTTSTTSSVPPDLSQVAPEPDGTLSPPAGVRRPWSATVPGLLTFRGNPTRSYYGKGPVPAAPEIRWTYPASGAMCADSTVGDENLTRFN